MTATKMSAALAACFSGMFSLAYAQDIENCGPGKFTRPAFILRQDFNDVPILTCEKPDDAATAVGTRLSATADRLSNTESLSIDGLAALDFQYDAFNLPGLNGIALGPFVQVTGNRQFATSTMSGRYSDTLTGGVFVEFGFQAPFSFIPGLENLVPRLRIHGGELTTSTGVRDPSFVMELIPIDSFIAGGKYRHIGGDTNHEVGFDYTVSPELEFQYDRLAGGPRTFQIFAKKYYATRIGPVFSARVFNFTNAPLVSLALTYHISVDTTTGRTFNSVQPTISYNFTKAGNAAISASYAYGNSDATGNLGSQFKVSLALKN